jgi:hypothetical protein
MDENIYAEVAGQLVLCWLADLRPEARDAISGHDTHALRDLFEAALRGEIPLSVEATEGDGGGE